MSRLLINFIFQDYESYGMFPSYKSLFKSFFVQKSYKIVLYFRLLQYWQNYKKNRSLGFLYRILRLRYERLCDQLNVTLYPETRIGKGVAFPHAFPIVINPASYIGKYCIINPCVLIGRDRGKDGAPAIGDYCFIGHGAKIVGNPKIGDWSFICPGAIVTKDVPEGALVGGVNKVINYEGKKHVLMYLSPKVKINNNIN